MIHGATVQKTLLVLQAGARSSAVAEDRSPKENGDDFTNVFSILARRGGSLVGMAFAGHQIMFNERMTVQKYRSGLRPQSLPLCDLAVCLPLYLLIHNR